MRFESVVDAVGHTPLVRLRTDERHDVSALAKLELQNLYGMKDRVAKHAIVEARRIGVLAEGAPIIESSSGTMALGVALVGTALGHPVHIVTDPRIDPITLAKLRFLGCAVHVVEAMSSHGWQSARLERLAQLKEDLPGAFWPDQYSNPDNPGAYRSLAEEILRDVGWFDILVGSVGSGGSLCGTARALRTELPELRVVGVDCVGSVLFGQPDFPGRLQSGLGNSLLPKNLDRRLIDEVHWLNDHEAFAAARELAREQQIFGGNTSGSVYRVMLHLVRQAAPGTRIVGIFADRGDRYVQTVYDDAYWEQKSLDEQDVRSAPESVHPEEVVRHWSKTPGPLNTGLAQHLLFVESNTTGTGMLALRTARELGLVPVLLTGDASRYAGLAETGCEVMVCDTGTQPKLRAAIQGRYRREELAGVTTTSEFYVGQAAELANWLGLPSDSVAAVTACRNKARLRELLAAAGVRQPRFAAVTDPEATRTAVRDVGLPCVVKPVDDTGSNDVLLCTTTEQAVAQAERIRGTLTNVRGLPTARTALVEEYLAAPEYSVEMFGIRGELHLLGITEKWVTGEPHFVEYGHAFPAPLSAEVAGAVEDVVRQALRTAGAGFGATHTEVRLTGTGPAVIEINPRPAGGMIPELIRLATGTDLLEQQLRVVAGMPPRLPAPPTRYAAIRFFLAGHPGRFREVRGIEEARKLDGVHQVSVTRPVGTTVRPARNAYDRLGFVIASGVSYEQAVRTCDEAHSMLDIDVRTDET